MVSTPDPHGCRAALVGEDRVWPPITLTEVLAMTVLAVGPVEHIGSPNKLHHPVLSAWKARRPEASIHAPQGLARKTKGWFRFDAELDDEPDRK